LRNLATGIDIARDALSVIRDRLPNPVVLVPPTVIDELTLAFTEPSNEMERKEAGMALRVMRGDWGFQPVDLVPVGHGIVDIIADKIRERGYLPDEERNDSLILAEAALMGCVLLVTSDRHLLDVPPGPLRLLLDSHSVSTPLIVSPHRLVRDYFR